MELQEFLEHMDAVHPADSQEMHEVMMRVGDKTRQLTAQLNGSYNTEPQVRALMSDIIGQPLDDGFRLFPPFTSDFGRNIHIGKNVFINSGCRFSRSRRNLYW